MNIKPQDIATLIELFESSTWDELRLKVQDFELFLSTDPRARTAFQSPAAVPEPALGTELTHTPPTVTAGQVAVGGSPQEHSPVPPNWVAVTAPNLGTFYRSPKPGSPPFVELGHAVEPQTELCLIEVMKLFTTLKAGAKGTIKRVCAKDGAMVEFGDILFYIEPS
jgi:acetyl-CoA carboxylase biotin carboxyl carrier protein